MVDAMTGFNSKRDAAADKLQERASPCARHCEAQAFKIEIRALKAQLAQPAQEPVAFICQGNLYMIKDVDKYCTAMHIPLYTYPPKGNT